MLAINKTYRYYDVFPRLVSAQSETQIVIRPRYDHVQFDPAIAYEVKMLPLEGVAGQTQWAFGDPLPYTLEQGALRINAAFEREQEYALLVYRPDLDEYKLFIEVRLYALEPDLFARRPFKGDMHMHSYYSDGKESPAYVAASCRRIGLDFMALTDHRKYAPSLEAIAAFEDVPVDLRIYPGEEIHPPGNPVHMINFGGSFSVNDLFQTERYQSEVEAIQESLDDWSEGVDRYTYSSCSWCFDRVREGGGLSIFCHPYWLTRHRYDVPGALVDELFARQPYDALELIGGYALREVESNTLQVARYHQEQAQGKRIPVVGVSDAHGCERGEFFGWYYTIVFAPSTDLSDLTSSIREFYSVAVEALPNETLRAFGPFRLVRYALFLMREILPLHDELCLEEGRLMLSHAAGDAQAIDLLKQLQGRTAVLYDHLWAK